MSQTSTRSVAEQIELLFDGGSATGLSDRQLLERFTARRDSAAETAFATLVARHGPTVMSVCLQLVGDAHHAEDAFQAVFLVLACKAKMIRDPDLLGNWLYGVAIRTAQRARARLMRQYKREAGCVAGHSRTGSITAIEPTALPLQQSILVDDELAALHDEIARLPWAFQLPVVLFYFEGLTARGRSTKAALAARNFAQPAGASTHQTSWRSFRDVASRSRQPRSPRRSRPAVPRPAFQQPSANPPPGQPSSLPPDEQATTLWQLPRRPSRPRFSDRRSFGR